MATKRKSKNNKVNVKRGDTFAMPTLSLPRKSVELKKASNGFVISSYHLDKGEELYIAKNKKEAQKHASKLLKI